MALVLDDAKLEAVVAQEQRRLERRRMGPWLEQLGRAYQWLDRPDEARAAFREGAELFRQKMDQDGRHDAGRQFQAGICLLHAGDADGAREWFGRALETARGLSVAELHYLLGDDDAAISAAEGQGEASEMRDAVLLLARARRDRDPALARQVRDVLVPVIRKERLTPGETSGPVWIDWDVVAESFRLEAELTDAPVPSYREMLAQLGLRPAEERA